MLMPPKKYKTNPAELDTGFRKQDYKAAEDEKYELEPLSTERAIFEEKPLPEERTIIEKKVTRRALPRMEETTIQPLKLMGEEVIGNLFDRVEFLKKRIEEVSDSIQTRDDIHKEMVEEINIDIAEKQADANRVADMDERRNFKLDISILRKEKRNENVQYWRDLVELKTELRELMEKFETENKIVDIFRGIGGTA